MTERPTLGIRLLHALGTEPDWATMTNAELAAFRDAENRKRASQLARVITGLPDRGATIRWEEVTLPDREVRVRVYRPASGADLPLVLHVHGGGFVGTAAQSDWICSHLAARLPAVVVSVEHRLLAADTPMPAAVADAWDVLRHVTADWGITRTAVLGESAGGMIAALVALRAKADLRAQVLVNPALDLTTAAGTSNGCVRPGRTRGSPSIPAPRTRSSACRAPCRGRPGPPARRSRSSSGFDFGRSRTRPCAVAATGVSPVDFGSTQKGVRDATTMVDSAGRGRGAGHGPDLGRHGDRGG